jgi:hypothetical protein
MQWLHIDEICGICVCGLNATCFETLRRSGLCHGGEEDGQVVGHGSLWGHLKRVSNERPAAMCVEMIEGKKPRSINRIRRYTDQNKQAKTGSKK